MGGRTRHSCGNNGIADRAKSRDKFDAPVISEAHLLHLYLLILLFLLPLLRLLPLILQTTRDKMHTRNVTYRHEYARKPGSNFNSSAKRTRAGRRKRKIPKDVFARLKISLPPPCDVVSRRKIVFHRGRYIRFKITNSNLPRRQADGERTFLHFLLLRGIHISLSRDENEGLIPSVPICVRERERARDTLLFSFD